ncbi:uncharacterized protein LOC119355950 isoform X2 [Triticum dicoccoides]|uniref:uncharacterized protein LOC119355950 isoform X2 n=1 Tax=Triticum dicoccoides TaxID=85692 RepID=UPI00188DE1CA|nr:uncharacterized protein LOC119355950 isoform X2 [Triticum dicoccoides]
MPTWSKKKNTEMVLVNAEKKGSEMALVEAEKKGYEMALVDAEKDLMVAVKNSEETLVVGEKNSKKALVEPDWDQLLQDLMARLSFAPKKDPVVADEELSMRDLELTVEELDLLQQAAIDLASLKTKEAGEFASAAACFKSTKESSSIHEPEPTKEPISTGDLESWGTGDWSQACQGTTLDPLCR